MTVEEVVVQAESEQDAIRDARNGVFLEMDILECSDISEISNEVTSAIKLDQ
jgi:hypothetical protein